MWKFETRLPSVKLKVIECKESQISGGGIQNFNAFLGSALGAVRVRGGIGQAGPCGLTSRLSGGDRVDRRRHDGAGLGRREMDTTRSVPFTDPRDKRERACVFPMKQHISEHAWFYFFRGSKSPSHRSDQGCQSLDPGVGRVFGPYGYWTLIRTAPRCSVI